MFQVMSLLLRGTFTARVIAAMTAIPHVDAAMSQNSADVHLSISSHASPASRAVRTKGGMNLTKCT